MRLRGARGSDLSGDRVLVELVESDDVRAVTGGPRGPVAAGVVGAPGPSGNPADPADPADAPPARRRPLWWAGAAVLVVLAIVATVANVAEARRAADRRAELAALPWIMSSLDGPLEEVWRAPGAGVIAVTPDVVVLRDADGGTRAVDPVTGAQLWVLAAAAGESCGSVKSSWPYALTADETGDAVLVCETDSEPDTETGGTRILGLRTVDPRTGETLADLSVDGILNTGALVDDDLVLVVTRPDGTLVVDRTDLRTGERVWQYEGEPGSGQSDFSHSMTIWVTDTAVLVRGERDLALSVETGEVLPADQVPAMDDLADVREELADGGTVQLRFDRSGGVNGSGRVLDADGSVRFTFEGNLMQPRASGGAQTVLVIQRWSADGSTGATVALDLLTGEELWSEPSDWQTTGLLGMDDRLLIASAAARMVDARTGRELWQLPLDASATMYGPVTDGDVVVLPIRDRGPVLAAVDLATGEERWRMPGPDGISVLGAAGRALVLAITGTEVVAYRPGGPTAG